jgi:hypothetical protein
MLRKIAIALSLLLLPALAHADIPMQVKLNGAERGLLAARLNQQLGADVYKTQSMPKTGYQHAIGITGGSQISVDGKVGLRLVASKAPGKLIPFSLKLYGPFAVNASLIKPTVAAPWSVQTFSATKTRLLGK